MSVTMIWMRIKKQETNPDFLFFVAAEHTPSPLRFPANPQSKLNWTHLQAYPHWSDFTLKI